MYEDLKLDKIGIHFKFVLPAKVEIAVPTEA